ncbi:MULTISPECIES: hypothetical protein [Streptosporangium]|uniref:FXSXX-COOH protein n=1 Tax=Streptosporangium brasiliense TaxID=47480 RepID=A0ABT9RIA6_9ACTN|nr:hypothetical protein [Streptosporangium brasiliense]MDP9869022.1 hypothetical protein [Streptosporangium brasiliense]
MHRPNDFSTSDADIEPTGIGTVVDGNSAHVGSLTPPTVPLSVKPQSGADGLVEHLENLLHDVPETFS